MGADQKFGLIKIAIIAMTLALSFIAMIWIVVHNNPRVLEGTIDLSSQKVQVHCEFKE